MISILEKIIGYITRYRFHNEENSYSIATLKTQDERNITIVGHFPKVTSDLLYELEGSWVEHPTYGEQFKVETFRRAEVASKDGLVTYLSSDYFPGIGPKTATKIVEAFGQDAIAKILEDKFILRDVGLNAIRIEKLYQQLLENQTFELVSIDLYDLDIKGATAIKLIAFYGNSAAAIVKTNPYRLIDDITGIGFIRADEIGQKVGIPKDDKRRVKAAILYAINEYGHRNGDVYATEEQVFDYANKFLQIDIDYNYYIEELITEKKLVLEDNRYYLGPIYHAEVSLAKKIVNIVNQPNSDIDNNKLEEVLDKVEKTLGINYTQVQKEAIKTAIINPLTVITGGPGTGKTTIIDGLMQVYREINQIPVNHMSSHIKVMAPTGRAAKRMREILDFNATTIHKGLGMGYDGKFTYDENNLIPEQLIIVDEASMIDVYLANALFRAIKNNAQVVIVGDVDQLPSVGPGLFLKDLITSEVVKVVRLDQIHRQAQGSNIIKIANKVNNQTLEYADLVTDSDTYIYQLNKNELKHIIKKLVSGAIEQGYSIIDDIQILIPQYKGDLGIDIVNKMIQEMHITNKDVSIIHGEVEYFVGDKVIQLENNTHKDIMNGDIGLITGILYDHANRPTVLIEFEGREISFTKIELDQINLAYAISIHKSQGSEYPVVIIPVVKSYLHMLRKELLYTAITRAKSYLFIMGDVSLMIYAANQLITQRQSTLAKRLNDSIELSEHQEDLDEISPYDFL